VADLVREALRQERRRTPERDAGVKLAAVRAAARGAFPTGDIADLLAEIEAGYLARTPQ
jgi:hypothetical protein